MNAPAATRRVRRLPVDPGPAGWNALLDPPDPPTPLDGDRRADWLVIGGGFAGLAAARRLTQLRGGDRIVLLEASRIGDGPAGRNSGFMIDLPHDLSSDDYGGGLPGDQAQTASNRAAIAFAGAAAADYDLPAEAFERWGKVNAAATERGLAHNRRYAGHLAAMGEAHEVLDAQAMRALTGTEYYVGGLYTPGTVLLQPALFVRGVAAGLARAGVAVFEQSPVLALERDGAAVRARTPAGAVTAPRVVLAVNGHAESFGFFARRLMHVFTYASMTRRLSAEEVAGLGGQARWGATPADPMGTTVRRVSGRGGDRLVVRNRFTYDPGLEVSAGRLAAVARTHDASFAARFPKLAGIAMDYRWGGRLCLSWNGVPAFGEVDTGVFAACCQNGLGTTKGTLAGIAAAELAADAPSDLVTAHQASPVPSRLPPEPLAWIGANATLRLREWKAGREL